jgi:hypothetical protein
MAYHGRGGKLRDDGRSNDRTAGNRLTADGRETEHDRKGKLDEVHRIHSL